MATCARGGTRAAGNMRPACCIGAPSTTPTGSTAIPAIPAGWSRATRSIPPSPGKCGPSSASPPATGCSRRSSRCDGGSSSQPRVMGLFANLRRNRAARQYARALPSWLARSYGASPHYLVTQIDAAITALKLPREFAAFGYAAFLSPEDYEVNRRKLSHHLEYDLARALFREALPRRPTSASGDSTDS